MQEIISLCRPIEGVVYCDRCCNRSGSGCFMHGDLDDGTKGCRGWHGRIFQGVTQPLGCQDFLCWDTERLKDAETQRKIREFFDCRQGFYNAKVLLDQFDLHSKAVRELMRQQRQEQIACKFGAFFILSKRKTPSGW